MDRVGEIDAVEVTRHANVGEQRGDIGPFLELDQCVGGVAGFDDFIPRIFECEVGMDPDKGVVIDDENNGLRHNVHIGSNIRHGARVPLLIIPVT